MVTTATFLSDTLKYIRNELDTNITDPVSSSRSGRERFVMTSYPKRGVKYPIITVSVAPGLNDIRLGQASEASWVTITLEVRVWARNTKEKIELFEQVHDYLRSNQFGGGTASVDDENLHDFRLVSLVPVDEDGEAGIRSMVSEYEYKTVLI